MLWRFRAFVSETGRNDVQKAINRARATIVETFKVRLRYLANTDKLDWHEPDAKKLQGVQDIYEIRFKADNRQHRPLGFFGPETGQFTVLVWAEKKQNIYDPPSAIETAVTRRRLVLARAASTAALTIDGEEFPPSI